MISIARSLSYVSYAGRSSWLKLRKNKVLFVNLCRCMRKKLPTEKTTVKVREEMDRLWQLLQTTLIPVLLLIRKHLDPFNDIAFRGMSFASEEHLFQFCTNLSCSLYLEGIQSWTSNLQIAIKFSEPNKGKQTSSDLLWLLLKKRGYADYTTTEHGLNLVFPNATIVDVTPLTYVAEESEL